jgi:hypothetical protein
MKRKIFLVASLALLLAFVALSTGSAYAQSADGQSWKTAITYYTPSDVGGQMLVSFYAEGSATPIMADPINLAGHQAGTLLVSSVTGLPSGFSGSAVLSAEVPIVAVDVQIAGDAPSYARPLYSGFSPQDANDTFFIPTFLYQKFNNNTTMGIQNIETSQITVQVKAYAAGATNPTYNQAHNIAAQSTVILTGADMSLPAGFTGSVVIDGTGAQGGRVVASAYEAEISGRAAKAFEGVAGGANTVYMPSMLCNTFGSSQTSYYAIQNASLSSAANVTVKYYDVAGNLVATKPTTNIPAGSKISTNPCADGAPSGVNGSAVIEGDGNDSLIAVGKVNGTNGMVTAFVGDAAGSTNSAASYIRWANNSSVEFRSYIAVMNVGNSTANNVKVKYYNANGTLVATHNLPALNQFIKANSNPSSAGALDANGEFGTPQSVAGTGGAIEVESDQPVVVVVRLSKDVSFGSVTRFAEDYNAKNVAP